MRGLTPGKNKFIEEREEWIERKPLVEADQAKRGTGVEVMR